MVELRAQEQQILTALQKSDGKASVEQLMHESKLSDSAVMRSALILQEKDLIRIHAEMQTVVKLTVEGEEYAKNCLPERRLVNSVIALGEKTPLDKAAEEAGLEKQFVLIALEPGSGKTQIM